MKRKTIVCLFAGAVLVLSSAASLQAQAKFYGDFLFGFRLVDTSGPGADYKYREDINLHGGARLYNFNFSFSPDNGFKKLFDRFDVQMYNLGGDPYETLTVRLQKYGAYTLQYDRKKSNYFYHDLFQGDGGGLYDLQTFDFDRVTDSGLAKVWLGEKADLYVDFNRYTKKGASTTTQDVERVEYEFQKPVQEESKEISVGLDFHFNRYSFVLEEKFLDYRNENSYFLPGYADGGPGAEWPSSLSYYSLSQPYDLKSNTHSLRFNARPIRRLFLTGSAQISHLDTDLDYSESAQGTSYLERKFQFDLSGKGKFERNMQMYEVEANYSLLTKLSLVGAFRYHHFDQTGSMTVAAEQESIDFGYKTLGVDAGIQYEFASNLALTLGYRFEDRNLDNLETLLYESHTTQQGAFGNIKWDPLRTLKLTLDYEHSMYENPFTLISPTDFDRLRLTAKYQVKSWSITGSYLWNNTKSDIEEDLFKSSKNQFNLRGGYHGERLKVFIGYAYIQAKRQGERAVTYPPFWTGPGGTFLWEIFYEGKANLFDLNISYDLNQNWKLGGYANAYSNRGSWKLDRTMFKAYLEYTFTAGYIAQVGYRHVDFKEKLGGFDNYRANIVELSFGYRWK
jgi:hypothetical protein